VLKAREFSHVINRRPFGMLSPGPEGKKGSLNPIAGMFFGKIMICQFKQTDQVLPTENIFFFTGESRVKMPYDPVKILQIEFA
jgi:hypothetical protein